jgi:FtsZ-interacting cell division protein YlmF
MQLGFHDDRMEEETQGSLHVVSAPGLTMAIRSPKRLEDVVRCGDILLSGAALLVDYENLPEQERIRAMDYLSGVAYPVDATETELLPTVILYLPVRATVVRE